MHVERTTQCLQSISKYCQCTNAYEQSIIIVDLISAKLKNLIEEKDLPQSSLAEVRKLKEWAEQRPKPSPRKGTGNCTKSHNI